MSRGAVVSILFCAFLTIWTFPSVTGFLFSCFPNIGNDAKLFIGMLLFFSMGWVYSQVPGIHLAVILDLFVFKENDNG
jgi:hypothetical protein